MKNTNTWKLNNMLLNKQQITEENKKEMRIETNDNENMATQNLQVAIKVVLKGNFIAIQAYLKKQERHQINNLILQVKKLEKEQQQQQQQQTQS